MEKLFSGLSKAAARYFWQAAPGVQRVTPAKAPMTANAAGTKRQSIGRIVCAVMFVLRLRPYWRRLRRWPPARDAGREGGNPAEPGHRDRPHVGRRIRLPSIARTRIDAMAAKFTGMIKFYAPDEDEAAGLTELFKKSQTTGARLVATNQIDCISAELQLVGLEISSRTEAPEGGSVMPARLSDNPAQEAAPAVRGVTANEIRFGTSAPFSGANKIYGQQIKAASKLPSAPPTTPAVCTGAC